MSAPVRPFLFTQIGLDSGALTMLGAIVRRFGVAGDYRGVVTHPGGGRWVFHLTVEEGRPAVQADVDLVAVVEASAPSPCHCGADHGGAPHHLVGTRGHVVFHVSGGAGGYAVHVSRAEEGPSPKEFDSRRLSDGDLFAATILRPGRYAVTNEAPEGAGARASIEVGYPVPGRAAGRPPEPARVRSGRAGFEPSEVRLTARQGCVFECEVPSRIRIELEEPYEPPADAERGAAG
jgi:hypothetical protein